MTKDELDRYEGIYTSYLSKEPRVFFIPASLFRYLLAVLIYISLTTIAIVLTAIVVLGLLDKRGLSIYEMSRMLRLRFFMLVKPVVLHQNDVYSIYHICKGDDGL